MVALLSLLHIVIIGTLAFLFWRGQRDRFFWPALVIKLSAGLSLGLLYQYYYQAGDTWIFFHDAEKLANAIIDQPKNIFHFFWNDDFSPELALVNDQPRSLFLIKAVAILNLLTGNNYWITSLYLSTISFFTSWMLYRTMANQFPDLQKEVALSILCIPSILFWGSGIIKESLAIAALFGVTTLFISWYYRRSATVFSMIVGLFFFWILWNLKYYWAGVWLAVVVPTKVIQILKNRLGWVNSNPKWSWFLFLLLALSLVSIIHPNFYYDRLLLVIVENHYAYLKLSNSGEAIHFYKLEPSFLNIIINSPWAFFSGVFRPFLFEATNLLQIGASIENLFLLVLFIWTIIRIKKILPQITELHLALITYIILLSIFLTLSTPNFGSLSRFKIGFTPFLWLGLLSASRVLKNIPFLK